MAGGDPSKDGTGLSRFHKVAVSLGAVATFVAVFGGPQFALWLELLDIKDRAAQGCSVEFYAEDFKLRLEKTQVYTEHLWYDMASLELGISAKLNEYPEGKGKDDLIQRGDKIKLERIKLVERLQWLDDQIKAVEERKKKCEEKGSTPSYWRL